MMFHSSRDPERRRPVPFSEAVLRGLAPDGGLYMPDHIPDRAQEIRRQLDRHSLLDLARIMLEPYLQGDIPEADLQSILEQTFSFPIPLAPVEPGIFSLELFHGPTLAFKDVGARFMALVMSHLNRDADAQLNVLVATSGDTGGAVAAGFHGVPGIHVTILYPRGKVSMLQEKQLTGWGGNITAIEVEGSFDDCQTLVKKALGDESLSARMRLTSANSINIARLLPQSVYYGWAVAQWWREGGSAADAGPVTAADTAFVADGIPASGPVISIPSGNFGNLTAALMASRIGVPIGRLIAATNRNDVVPDFLTSGRYQPRPSVSTLSNAMDVGAPSNFERLTTMLGAGVEGFRSIMSGSAFDDEQVCQAIREVHARTGYLLDPHGAIGYLGLKAFGDAPGNAPNNAPGKASNNAPGEPFSTATGGIFLETAHPIKFRDEVIGRTGIEPDVPAQAREVLGRAKQAMTAPADEAAFREILLGLGR